LKSDHAVKLLDDVSSQMIPEKNCFFDIFDVYGFF